MRERIRHRLVFAFILLANTQVTYAACVDRTQLAHSIVGIMRHFDDTDARPDLIGIRATGWFLSPTTIVTAEHVTLAMKLSTTEWKSLEILDGDTSQFVAARIQRLSGGLGERLAVIELQSAVSGARTVAIRKEPLVPEEQIMTLAYPGGRPHFVGGRFVRFGDDGKLAGTALLEIYGGDNRLVIDHGASGAPVVDCAGRVAAVVSNVFTQSMVWGSRKIQVPTPWGTPNVVSLPVQALDDTPQAD